jgi:hypothetical protein
LRPSASVTIKSAVVNSTDVAYKSPTSISKVVMPGFQNVVPMCFQVADDTAEFVRRETEVDRNGHVAQPNFGLTVARTDMKMRRLTALIGIEEASIAGPAQHGGHPGPPQLNAFS